MVIDEFDLFKAALEQLPEGLVVINEDEKIILVNRASEEIRRIAKEEVIGQSVLLCHPENSRDKVTRALQFLKGGSGSFKRVVTDYEKGKYYENTYGAIKNHSGRCIGLMVITRDITKRRRLEEERALHLQHLEEKVTELTQNLNDLLISSMTSLVNTLEAKDPYTKGHSLRVKAIASKMGEHVWGISPRTIEVELAGELHDIGKIGIRESVLHKPARLSDEEFDHIKEHSVVGERILMPFDRLKPVAKLVRHHHERFDGQGYPDRLKGEEIPAGSRILALADAYDAMTSNRPYRSKMPLDVALGEINKNLGKQFDPEWGKVFLELFYSGSIG